MRKYVTEVSDEYIEMAFEAYYLGHISLRLAKLLEIPLEEALIK